MAMARNITTESIRHLLQHDKFCCRQHIYLLVDPDNPGKYIIVFLFIIDICLFFLDFYRQIVAMARNITTESIRHLLQHSDLIDEYKEDGTVIPSRILNVYKEESVNIYENRFICTLMAELQYFVNKRFNVIFDASKDEIGTFFEVESRVDNYTAPNRSDSSSALFPPASA